MRRRRTTTPTGTGVTGSGTPLGRALLDRLPDAQAVDAAGLAGLRTVVHLDVSYDVTEQARARRARTVDGAAALLEAARSAGVQRVVLVTGLDVHASPPPGSAVPLPEDLPLRADPDSALTGDLLEVERLADHATRTGLEVLVLRPAPVVGGALGPAYDGVLLQSLSGPRLLAVRGVEPLWQVCHSDDLLSALELAAGSDLTGAAAVASAGWLPQREVEVLSRQRRVELPASVATSTAERLHRAGLTRGSPAELDRLLAPLVVDPRRLREAGWAPAWTTRDALVAHLAARPAQGGRAGAYTAAGAGATVALVGTAALVRRARRRRGR
jgi:nucleoside-diphosphate-sugar epimerase